MSWVAIALLSAGVSALVSIFDKTVLHRYARTHLTLPLIIGFAQSAVGLTVIAVVGLPEQPGTSAVAQALLSGALFGLSGQILLRVLYSQEVSRTIPVSQTAPIFAALIAFFVLDEVLTPLQWVAVIATVAGAVLLSLRRDAVAGSIFLHGSFALLMLAALILATGNVVGKSALNELPVLFTHGLRMLALGAVFLIFNARPEPWADVRGFVSRRSPALLLVGLNELVIANAGLLLLLWALSEGPVAAVTALVGTRALFVVLYGTAIAFVHRGALGEELSREAIAVKLGSTCLIVAGVAAISI